MKHNEDLMLLTNQLDAFKREHDSQTQAALAFQRKAEKEKQTLTSSLNDYKIQVSNLQHELDLKSQEVKRLEEESKIVTQDATDLSKFIQDYTTNKELELKELKTKLATLSEEHSNGVLVKSTLQTSDSEGLLKELAAKDALILELKATLELTNDKLRQITDENPAIIKQNSEENSLNGAHQSNCAKNKDAEIDHLKELLQQANHKVELAYTELEKSKTIIQNEINEQLAAIEEKAKAAAKTTLESLQNQIESKNQLIEKLRSESNLQDELLKNLGDELNVVQRELNQIQEDYSRKETALLAEIDQLKLEYSKKDKSHREIAENLNKITEERSKREIELEIKNEEKETKVQNLMKTVDDQSKILRKLETMESDKAILENQLSQKSNKLKSLEENFKIAQNENINKGQELKRISSSFEEARARIERFEDENQSLNAELKIKDTALLQAKETTELLTHQLEQQGLEMANINQKLAEITVKFKDLQEEKKSLLAVIETNKMEAAKSEEFMKNYQNQLKQKVEEVSTIKKFEEDKDALIKKLEQEKINYINSLEETSRRTIQLEETQKNLEKELDKTQQKVKLATEKEAEMVQETEKLRENIERKELEFVSIQTELERVNSLLEMAEKTIQNKDVRLVELLKQNSLIQEQARKFHDLMEQNERELAKLTSEGFNYSAQELYLENQRLKGQLTSLSIEFENLKATKDGMADFIHLSNGLNKPPQNDLEGLKHDIRQITEDKNRYAEAYTAMKTRADYLERENISLKSDPRNRTVSSEAFEHPDNRLAMLQKQFRQLEENNTMFSRQLALQTEELSNLKIRNKEKEEVTQKLKEELKVKTEECESYKTQVLSLKETAEELIDDYKANEELQGKYKKVCSELKTIKKELEASKKLHEEDKKDLKKRLDHNKKLVEAYEKQRIEYQQAVDGQNKAVNECEVLQEEVIKLRASNRELETQLKQSSNK